MRACVCRPESFIKSELEKYGPQVIYSRYSDVAHSDWGEAGGAGAGMQYQDAEGAEGEEEEEEEDFEEDDLMWFDGHEGVTGNFTKTFKAEVSGHRPNRCLNPPKRTPKTLRPYNLHPNKQHAPYPRTWSNSTIPTNSIP